VSGSAHELESLLSAALRPIEPPESVVDRVEGTVRGVADAAAEELAQWAEEISESELLALRDPRNWLRPVVAVAAGSAAAGALLVIELRRRPTRARRASDVVRRLRDR